MDRRATTALLAGLPIAIGLSVSGFFIGNGLLAARAAERRVTVKGLAERDVRANLALWPIGFTVTADDLETLHTRFQEDAWTIRSFLVRAFPDGEIGISVPRVTDRDVQRVNPGRVIDRYVAEATVTLRTGRVEQVKETMEKAGDLVKQGVALVSGYRHDTRYLYVGLDRIKPEMIAEATQDARRAAQQFAIDSGSRVGAIRSARQGFFSITDRDAFSPEVKTIRVVSTVQYFLVDD